MTDPSTFELARRVADAVLYEGYVLYPYRASSQKNQLRWQWGVLAPQSYAEAAAESWWSQTECLLEPAADTSVHLTVRFLQAQHRTVEVSDGDGFRVVDSLDVDGDLLVTWDEGVEHEVEAELALDDLLASPQPVAISVAGGEDVESVVGGRVVRRRWPLSAVAHLSAERLEGPYGVVKLRVRTENLTTDDALAAGNDAPPVTRDDALRRSLIAAHTLLQVRGGTFLSLLEHPEWARGAVESCDNVGTWPVLAGPAGATDVVLSSPIILYDHPEIAAESAGELYDGTEIDEILTLRTMALTDEEKREARGTDVRSAALIDRVDAMPPELLDRLHGTIRYLREATGQTAEPGDVMVPNAPWWDPGADASVSPEDDKVWVGDVAVGKGSRVRLHPGQRRTDAQDMFLTGRIAQVEAVLLDVDDNRYLAVTLADDPAADLQQWHGRFLYFHPDEVEAL